MDDSQTIVRVNTDEKDRNACCSNCGMRLGDSKNIVEVERGPNRIVAVVCDECARLSKALWEIGRLLPGMEPW